LLRIQDTLKKAKSHVTPSLGVSNENIHDSNPNLQCNHPFKKRKRKKGTLQKE